MQEKPKMDVKALQSKLWKMFSRYALLNDLVISKACEFNPKQLVRTVSYLPLPSNSIEVSIFVITNIIKMNETHYCCIL